MLARESAQTFMGDDMIPAYQAKKKKATAAGGDAPATEDASAAAGTAPAVDKDAAGRSLHALRPLCRMPNRCSCRG
jgi:hypothetical protein